MTPFAPYALGLLSGFFGWWSLTWARDSDDDDSLASAYAIGLIALICAGLAGGAV